MIIINNIYDVKVCNFNSMEMHGNVCRLNYEKIETHYCVVDFDKSLAIDIFTNEQFHILSKNGLNQIKETEEVELNKNYATYVSLLDYSRLTKEQQRKLKWAYFKFNLLRQTRIIGLEKGKQNVIKR